MGPITPSGSSPGAGPAARPRNPGGPPGGGGWSKNPAARRSSNSSSFIAGMCRMCSRNAWSRRRRAPPLGAGGTNPTPPPGAFAACAPAPGTPAPGGGGRCPKMASKIPFSTSRPNAALTTWSNNPRAAAPPRRPRAGGGGRGACRAAALLCATALSRIAFASFFCQCRTSFSAMSRSLSSDASASTSSRWPASSNFSR